MFYKGFEENSNFFPPSNCTLVYVSWTRHMISLSFSSLHYCDLTVLTFMHKSKFIHFIIHEWLSREKKCYTFAGIYFIRGNDLLGDMGVVGGGPGGLAPHPNHLEFCPNRVLSYKIPFYCRPGPSNVNLPTTSLWRLITVSVPLPINNTKSIAVM